MPPEYEITDRGFKRYADIEATRGAIVRVYESSAAAEPCVWLTVTTDVHLAGPPHAVVAVPDGVAPGEAFAHLTLEQARTVRDTLDAAIRNHYQGEALPDAD